MFKLMCVYTFKTLFRKRKFTLASIISIILFIVSIVSIFIVGMSTLQSYKSYLNGLYGSYTGVVQISDAEMLNEIEKSSDIKESSVIFNYGTIEMQEPGLNDRYSIAYMEGSALSLASITLLDGRLPVGAGEVLIEESVLQKLNGNIGIDDFYPFSIECKGKTVTKNYKIVGKTSDYSAFQLMRAGTASLWPSVIMTSQDKTLTVNEVYLVASSKNNNPEILQSFSEKYSSQLFISQQFSNEAFINNVGGSTQAILIIGMVAVFVIALLCLSSFSSLSAVVIDEQIKSLKFIGASSSSMLLFGILNLIMLYLIALPIGFLVGIACGYGLSSYIVAGFVDFYEFNISLSGIVIGILAALILLLLVRVIKILIIKDKKPFAQSKREKLHIKNGKSLNHGSLFLKWSVTSILKNKCAYLGIALSMTVCFFVLFMGGVYNQTVAKEYDVHFQDHYKIRYMDGEFFSSLFIPTNPYAGIDEGDITTIQNNGELDTFSYIKQLRVLVDISTEDQIIGHMSLQNVRQITGTDSNQYEAELAEYGITPSGNLYTGLLDACDNSLISKLLKSENTEGISDSSSFDEKNEVIIVHRSDVSVPFKIGENARLIQLIAKDGYETKPADRMLLDLNLRVSAIVEIDKSEYLYDKFYGSALAFVCSDAALKDVGLNLNYNYLYLNLKDPTVYSETQKGVNHLNQLYPEMTIVSERENEAEKYQLLHTLNLIVVILSIFIFTVCLFNIINILSMKYLSDKKLWGTLRAMGISRFRVVLYHFAEMLAVMLVSVLLSACFLLVAGQIIRSDVTIFNSFVLYGYFVCPLLICLFTLPIVLSVFNQNIIKQIEYLG
ncbi:MAG: ABC transporter permease [Clostridiales bacterium]|nr:ABC transporter permease [Clostridiales bacterium]